MLDFITGFDETQPLHCLGSSVHSFKFLLYYMRRNGNDRASQAHLSTHKHTKHVVRDSLVFVSCVPHSPMHRAAHKYSCVDVVISAK